MTRRAACRGLVERQRGDRVGALAVGRPGPGFLPASPPRLDIDPIGDHESRIEADAELADQLRRLGARPAFARVFHVACVGGLQFFEKGAGAGTRDRAECKHEIVGIHADAVVGDRQRLGVLVERENDREGGTVGSECRVAERLVAELFAGVRGVGDEFAQENIAFRVNRMHHQAQKARYIGLECVRVGSFGRRSRGA